MKPGTLPMQSTRLLDLLCEHIRYMHYSLSTEKVDLYWVRFFVRWHGRNGQMKECDVFSSLDQDVMGVFNRA